jgi:hypothetical protein
MTKEGNSHSGISHAPHDPTQSRIDPAAHKRFDSIAERRTRQKLEQPLDDESLIASTAAGIKISCSDVH